MSKKKKKKPALQPNERIQAKPGEFYSQLHPVVRSNIEMLARTGFDMKGRGVLFAQLNDATTSGIESAQYASVAELERMNATTPSHAPAPVMESARQYDPTREFVVMIVEPTRTNPLMYYDVVLFSG